MRKPKPSAPHNQDIGRDQVKQSTTELQKRMPLKALPIFMATTTTTAATAAPPPLKVRHVSFQEEGPSVVEEGRWHREYDLDSWRVSDN